ncbi:hypothetical protein R1flu_017458 [Riccia fluitans]|uniref:Uncharacterized protein n=1 Tax=Riccia fluitans TaxID=41844 RepID=A0ABD1ZDB2_9MARC
MPPISQAKLYQNLHKLPIKQVLALSYVRDRAAVEQNSALKVQKLIADPQVVEDRVTTVMPPEGSQLHKSRQRSPDQEECPICKILWWKHGNPLGEKGMEVIRANSKQYTWRAEQSSSPRQADPIGYEISAKPDRQDLLYECHPRRKERYNLGAVAQSLAVLVNAPKRREPLLADRPVVSQPLRGGY